MCEECPLGLSDFLTKLDPLRVSHSEFCWTFLTGDAMLTLKIINHCVSMNMPNKKGVSFKLAGGKHTENLTLLQKLTTRLD